MSRGHGEGIPRRERRHRDDRRHDRLPRDHKAAHASAPPRARPDEFSPPPEYTTDPEHDDAPRYGKRGHHAPPLHRRGLNEDYYNPAPEEAVPPRTSHHRGGHQANHRDGTHGRSRPHTRPPTEPEEESDYDDWPKRRAKTEPRGRRPDRSRRRHDSDPSESDEYYASEPERPTKPSRGKSFLHALGIVKDKHDDSDYERGRSPRHSPHRGRRGYREYSYSPSPPRRHRSAREPRNSGHGRPSINRTNTNWQRAAGSAMRAGASAAYELRHDPSPWMGPKGIRVATAALGAAVMDSMMDDDYPRRSGRSRSGGVRSRAMRGLGEAALRHVVTGSGRSRSRYY